MFASLDQRWTRGLSSYSPRPRYRHGRLCSREGCMMGPRPFTVVRDDPEAKPVAPELEVVCMADVRPRAIDWLWQNWVAIGKTSVHAGDGGKGKSTVLCDLAARTSTSEAW